MFDIRKMCGAMGLTVPAPGMDSRGRRMYRIGMLSAEQIYSVARYLHDGGCRPTVRIPTFARETVEIIENRKDEVWYFKHYARSEEHAATMEADILTALEPHRNYQMEFMI